MSELSILSLFKKSLISFVDELITQFPQEADLIILRIFIKDQAPIEDIINKFIYAINKDDQKIRNYVKNRDGDVFVKNDLFEAICKTKNINFQKLWNSDNLDDSDREMIWKWIDSFVTLADRYTKAKNNSF